jgi:hypothetical protein
MVRSAENKTINAIAISDLKVKEAENIKTETIVVRTT